MTTTRPRSRLPRRQRWRIFPAHDLREMTPACRQVTDESLADRPLADESLVAIGAIPGSGCSPAPFDAVDQKLVAQKNAFCLAAPGLIQRFQENDEEVRSPP
jgi:hypothetical protein